MTALRGRKPVAPSTKDAQTFVRQLKGLLKSYRAQTADHERYVQSMEKRYAAAMKEIARLRGKKVTSASTSTLRGQGPNVRDAAFTVLQERPEGLPIWDISVQVLQMKRGVGGANFVQNLGAALQRDRRFKRLSRGVYGLRTPRGVKK